MGDGPEEGHAPCDGRLRAKRGRSDPTQMQIMQFLVGRTGLSFPFRRYATISHLENSFAGGGSRIFLDPCPVFVTKNECGYFVLFSQSEEARFAENILQIIFGNNGNTPTRTLLLVPSTLLSLSESYSPFELPHADPPLSILTLRDFGADLQVFALGNGGCCGSEASLYLCARLKMKQISEFFLIDKLVAYLNTREGKVRSTGLPMLSLRRSYLSSVLSQSDR